MFTSCGDRNTQNNLPCRPRIFSRPLSKQRYLVDTLKSAENLTSSPPGGMSAKLQHHCCSPQKTGVWDTNVRSGGVRRETSSKPSMDGGVKQFTLSPVPTGGAGVEERLPPWFQRTEPERKVAVLQPVLKRSREGKWRKPSLKQHFVNIHEIKEPKKSGWILVPNAALLKSGKFEKFHQ